MARSVPCVSMRAGRRANFEERARTSRETRGAPVRAGSTDRPGRVRRQAALCHLPRGPHHATYLPLLRR
jgi:hypothetical protein